MENIARKLPSLPLPLKNEILEHGIIKKVTAGTELLRAGQYVKVIPIVLDGLLKVYSSYEDKELLLYYIEPSESCIMSFNAGMWNTPSKVFAIAEEDTTAILLPVDLMNKWVRQYPSLNTLFFQQYNQRYENLLKTIHHLLFDKMDKRLYNYLKERSDMLGEKVLNLRHHEIARELGTAREVVSRVMKKLEKEGKVRQHQHGIEVII